MSFHSQQSFSVSFFHISLGLPGPLLPSTCISHTILTAPLEHSTCPNQRSLSLKMRLRSSSFASSLLDLTVATSSGLILQICLIMACQCAAGSLVIPRRSRRDIVLASSLRPSVRPSVRNHISVPIGQI